MVKPYAAAAVKVRTTARFERSTGDLAADLAPCLNEVILCWPARMCCIATGSRLTKRCKQPSGLVLRLVYEPR